jgi:hypothetical protein
VETPDRPVADLDDNTLIERLAAVEHARWSHWQNYVHQQCAPSGDGGLTIPAELVERWQAQINTPYEYLSETEKESDREQVREYLPLIEQYLNQHEESR